ncbi:MAG: helix-turn-helix transcriptional regulator [Lachnospiraceae bacterium]|nr:helix-turn-helix transcriptional regulator [Lachnospiraceae bacterium]
MREKSLSQTIGSQLKQCRQSQGYMKQDEVAKKIGITKQALSSYESGRHIPALEILIKLADLYGCSVDWLIGRGDIGGQRLADDIQKMAFDKQKQIMISELRRFIRENWQVEL